MKRRKFLGFLMIFVMIFTLLPFGAASISQRAEAAGSEDLEEALAAEELLLASQTADTAAPVFSVQPEAVHFVYEGSGYSAPAYSVTAALPEGSEAEGLTLQWYVSGKAYGKAKTVKGTTASSKMTIASLAGQKSGVYPVFCRAECTVSGTTHTTDSYTTNFIVCKGVMENAVFTFSDLHENWDNVGQAIQNTIVTQKGMIPALVVATGDYNNNYCAGYSDAFINKCIETMIKRTALQLGGIDTVWVSGNHDNGYATGFTNANKEADLGLDEANYYDVAGGMSGTGIIYDSRIAPSAETSLANKGLIVIGINYEDIGSQGAYSDVEAGQGRPNDKTKLDYGTADSPDNTVYKYLEKALKKTAENYNGELIIISTHAGIHAVGEDPDSVAAGVHTVDTGEYSIRNSAAVVKLVNSYVDQYGMNIMWLFGHDHSRGEMEFYKVPGDTVYATVTPEAGGYEQIKLGFSYGHAGYITKNINGNQVYSMLTYDSSSVKRTALTADEARTPVTDITDKSGNKVYSESLDFTQKLTAGKGKSLTAEVTKLDASCTIREDFSDAASSVGYGPKAYYTVKAVWSDGKDATDEDVDENGGVVVTLPLPDGVTSADQIMILRDDKGTVKTIEDGFIFTESGVTFRAPAAGTYGIAVKGAAEDHSGHVWKFTGFTYDTNAAGTKITAAQAVYECKNNSDHTELADAVFKKTVTRPTCTEEGVTQWVISISAKNSLDGKAHKDDGFLEETTEATGHNWGSWVVTKEPTATKAGEKTRACKNNPNHKQTKEIPPVGVKYTFSKDSYTWTKNSGTALEFVVNRNTDNSKTYGLFKGVSVDSKYVSKSYYTAKEGSLKLIFASRYLQTLSAGKHSIVVTFEDGSAKTTFTVKTASSGSDKSNSNSSDSSKKKTNPKTGDDSRMILWETMLLASMLGIMVLLRLRRRGILR